MTAADIVASGPSGITGASTLLLFSPHADASIVAVARAKIFEAERLEIFEIGMLIAAPYLIFLIIENNYQFLLSKIEVLPAITHNQPVPRLSADTGAG